MSWELRNLNLKLGFLKEASERLWNQICHALCYLEWRTKKAFQQGNKIN